MKNSKLDWERVRIEKLENHQGVENYSSDDPKLNLHHIQCRYCKSALPNGWRKTLDSHLKHCESSRQYQSSGSQAHDPIIIRKNTKTLSDLRDLPGFPHALVGKLVKTNSFLGLATEISADGENISIIDDQGTIKNFEINSLLSDDAQR